MLFSSCRLAIASLAFLTPLAPAQSGSEQWIPTFGTWIESSAAPRAFALHDDGQGRAIYVGGTGTLTGADASRVARWNGTRFEPVGAQSNSTLALVSHDDGGGARLFAGVETTAGGTPLVAVFDGSAWQPFAGGPLSLPGFGGQVRTMVVHDDGSGPKLWVGGQFQLAGGGHHLAVWDGASWSSPGAVTGAVNALHSVVLGGIPTLLVGGDEVTLTTPSGAYTGVIAHRGGVWAQLGSVSGSVRAFATFDFGQGPRVVVAGGAVPGLGGLQLVTGAASSNVARWNGGVWEPLGGGFDLGVVALPVMSQGGVPVLYAAGAFQGRLRRWVGTTWRAVGALDNQVRSAFVEPLFTGDRLWLGGEFTKAGALALPRIGQWDGTRVRALTPAINGPVRALAAWDDGAGPVLYAGGEFTQSGADPLRRIGRFDGSWAPLGGGLDGTVRALFVHDDGSGEQLWVGGDFTAEVGTGKSLRRVARWDGSSWRSAGAGLDGVVRAFVRFDAGQGEQLIAGGSVSGSFSGLARWDGSAWTNVANANHVQALRVHTHEGHTWLYVGGAFSSAAGLPGTNGIVRFDGTTWQGIGSWFVLPSTSPPSGVRALASFTDLSGPALYAGGAFDFKPFATPPTSIGWARWSGTNWTTFPVGIQTGTSVDALAVDSTGSALYVAGDFAQIFGVHASNIVRRGHSAIHPLGSGQQGPVHALALIESGPLAGVYAGGSFSTPNESGDMYLGRYGVVSGGIQPLTGCGGNRGTLASPARSVVGRRLSLEHRSSVVRVGTTVLLGAVAPDVPGGCGAPLSGGGEWFLGSAPLVLGVHPISAGLAELSLPVPGGTALRGRDVTLQALAIGVDGAIELSNALLVPFGE